MYGHMQLDYTCEKEHQYKNCDIPVYVIIEGI